VLVKYDSNGTAQWAKSVTAGSNISWFNAVAADSAGNVYAAGTQYGAGINDYGTGISAAGVYLYGENLLIVKYDSGGTAQWAKSVSTGNFDSRFNALAADTSGNVYAAGCQNGDGTFTYSPGVTLTGTSYFENAVLVKYQ